MAGGPWLTPKKTGFFQLQSTFPAGAYSDLFLANGENLRLNRKVLDYNFQGYLEYGISDKFNITAVLPYKYIATTDVLDSLSNPTLLPEGSLNGFSNVKLGFKYRVLDKGIKAAISIQTSLNTISKDLDQGLATGYDANSVGLYGHVGRSFSANLYSFLEGGFNKASNDYSDFIELHYELGIKLSPPLWFMVVVDVRESLNNGSFRNDNLRQTGFYTNDQEYFAYGIKFAYELKNKLGFSLATFGAINGNYVAKVGTFSVGVHKKW